MKMIINGKKVDSVSGETFDVLAPATGKVIESVPKATAEDVEKAIDAAVAGQKVWEQVPISERAKVLYKFLDIVEQNKESLAQTLSAENGKPVSYTHLDVYKRQAPIFFASSSKTRINSSPIILRFFSGSVTPASLS